MYNAYVRKRRRQGRTRDALDEMLVVVPLLLVTLPVLVPVLPRRTWRRRGCYRTIRCIPLLSLAFVNRAWAEAICEQVGRGRNISGGGGRGCVRPDVLVVGREELESGKQILGAFEVCGGFRVV